MILSELKDTPYREVIEDEYMHLVLRGKARQHTVLPSVGILIEEVILTATWQRHEKKVLEAVEQRRYERYGVTKQEFVARALEGKFDGFKIQLINAEYIQDQVFEYLDTRHISFINYKKNVQNSPVKEVW